MSSGFKGTEIRIPFIKIEGRQSVGAVVRFGVQFTNKDGVVHAHTEHELETSADPRIRAAAAELYGAIKEWAGRTHFDKATATAVGQPVRGLAETLRGPADPADDLAGQG